MTSSQIPLKIQPSNPTLATMEVHASLFGNSATYATPLCASVDITKLTPWVTWVVHVDSSVPAAVRTELCELGDDRLRLVEHPPHAETAEGPLWRFAALRSTTNPGGCTMTWDADNFIFEFLPTIAAFGAAAETVWYYDPADGQTELYSFFESRVDAGFVMLKPEARTLDVDAALDAVPTCPDRYLECNRVAMHSRPEPWYCWDEFVLTYIVKPLWVNAKRHLVRDLPKMKSVESLNSLMTVYPIAGIDPPIAPVRRQCAYRPDLVDSVLRTIEEER